MYLRMLLAYRQSFVTSSTVEDSLLTQPLVLLWSPDSGTTLVVFKYMRTQELPSRHKR